MTRQRALILEILQHSPKHLTADEIFAIAREKMPGIARGTVYRNLKLMEQAREIARLEGVVAQQRQWNREKSIRTAESKLKSIARLEQTLEKPEDDPETCR